MGRLHPFRAPLLVAPEGKTTASQTHGTSDSVTAGGQSLSSQVSGVLTLQVQNHCAACYLSQARLPRRLSDQGRDFNEETSSPAHQGKALADGVQVEGGPNFARSFHFSRVPGLLAFTLGPCTQVSMKQPEDPFQKYELMRSLCPHQAQLLTLLQVRVLQALPARLRELHVTSLRHRLSPCSLSSCRGFLLFLQEARPSHCSPAHWFPLLHHPSWLLSHSLQVSVQMSLSQ